MKLFVVGPVLFPIMKTLQPLSRSLLAACGLALAATLTPATAGETAARTQVIYHQPETFTDLRDNDFESERGRQATLDQLRAHIQKRADSALPAGYTLSVVVSDVDLAGDYEPFVTKWADVRVVRAIYPPRINLEYTIKDARGEVLAMAKRDLTDSTFLYTLMIDRNDTLRHEKALIDSWIRRDIRRAVPAS